MAKKISEGSLSMLQNTAQTFGSVSKFLHWLIAFLVICMLFAGYFMGDIHNDSLKMTVINLHKLTGISILCLMLVRVLWALVNPKPVLPQGMSAFERMLELAGHFLLYGLIIAMPIAGWIGAVAGGYSPHAGSIVLNLPVPLSKTLSHWSFKIHGWLAISIIVMVSLHVLAALYHHFVRKDNVLLRMMPS
jgi:cytochrome b561